MWVMRVTWVIGTKLGLSLGRGTDILDFLSLAAIGSFTYNEPSYLTVTYIISLFMFMTIYVKYFSQIFLTNQSLL